LKVLIGSKALEQHILLDREPKDVDYISTEPIPGADVFYHADLEKWSWHSVASLDELYTLKVSHSFWRLKNNSFEKHLYDIMKMQVAGAKLIPELYNILYPIWEELHGKKKIDLSLPIDKFFNKNVTRTYEHDSLHASVADGQPMFERILKDGSKVAVDREKFERLGYSLKLKLVREEIYVTALERNLIPLFESKGFVNKLDVHRAYSRALRAMITNYSKGWFALWIVDNLLELRDTQFDYWQRFLDNQHKLILETK